ncbi:hypothetical protein BpHYR1_015734 [Brachionus plicatilis]|uniref:Uncharacterized protein n=1 Tax=Brachionus plicatilis TaxID=10195 RepID=A0A3M7RKH7_BRAPC|nr:hypothetical protein BpHYR1_015734 [Brachionus plicatilis]
MNNLRTKSKKTSRHRIRKNVKKVKQPSETSSSSCHLSSSKLDEQLEKLREELSSEKTEREKYKVSLKKLFVEKQELMEILKKCQSERDTFRFELESLKQMHVKELRRSKAELEALTKEYCQIMSERDNVHKEIEALQEKLNKSQDKVKQLNHTNSFNNADLNSTRHSNLNATILDDLQLDTVRRQLKIVTQQRDEAHAQHTVSKLK